LYKYPAQNIWIYQLKKILLSLNGIHVISLRTAYFKEERKRNVGRKKKEGTSREI
jgi:hypothetical protein